MYSLSLSLSEIRSARVSAELMPNWRASWRRYSRDEGSPCLPAAALPQSSKIHPRYFAHLKRFCIVVLLGVHEAGNLGGVFRILEGSVINVDALHSVLDVMRNVSVKNIKNS